MFIIYKIDKNVCKTADRKKQMSLFFKVYFFRARQKKIVFFMQSLNLCIFRCLFAWIILEIWVQFCSDLISINFLNHASISLPVIMFSVVMVSDAGVRIIFCSVQLHYWPSIRILILNSLHIGTFILNLLTLKGSSLTHLNKCKLLIPFPCHYRF